MAEDEDIDDTIEPERKPRRSRKGLVALTLLLVAALGVLGWTYARAVEEGKTAGPPVVAAAVPAGGKTAGGKPSQIASSPLPAQPPVGQHQQGPQAPASAAPVQQPAANPPQASSGQASSETTAAPAVSTAMLPSRPPAAAPSPPVPKSPPLPPAPASGLTEPSQAGALPVIGKDGRQPWRVYSHPFERPRDKPLVAVVITQLGLSGAATETAIQRLPGPVTLSFSPYARNLDRVVPSARAAGHEVLQDLPMEPADFPSSDPGPLTLLTSLSAEENVTRLNYVLGRFAGYVGVTGAGGKFQQATQRFEPVLETLRRRGLMLLVMPDADPSLTMLSRKVGLAFAKADLVLDAEASRSAIDAKLAELERIAAKKGGAIGVASPYPVTYERLAAWFPGLAARGLALAPVSALATGGAEPPVAKTGD